MQRPNVLAVCIVLALLLTSFRGKPTRADGLLTLPDPALFTDPIFARPGFANVAQPFLNRTRYLVTIDMQPSNGRLLGHARVLYVNNAAVALDTVIMRLYQNAPFRAGRHMMILAAMVDGQPVAGKTQDVNKTVYAIPLSKALQPGGTVTLDLDYQITLAFSSFFYVSEPFPIAAVYDETGWRTDVATKGLDWVYSESALCVVKLRTQTSAAVLFVGGTKSADQSPDGTTTYTIVTGPIRNFVFAQGRGWQTYSLSGGPVPVRVLYSADQAAAQEMATITVNAMNFYEQNFGPYPYAELDIVSMEISSGGEQYPTLVIVNNARSSEYRRFIVAHEVGHEWFYGIAGNDLLRHAWLDESLTQVAGYLFYKQTHYGSPTADTEYWSHILSWANQMSSPPRKIDTPLDKFGGFSDYMSTIYGGGAVFLRQLGEQIGDNALIAGMRAYVQEVNLGVGTSQEFFDAVQAQTSIDLKPLFCTKVGIMCS